MRGKEAIRGSRIVELSSGGDLDRRDPDLGADRVFGGKELQGLFSDLFGLPLGGDPDDAGGAADWKLGLIGEALDRPSHPKVRKSSGLNFYLCIGAV